MKLIPYSRLLIKRTILTTSIAALLSLGGTAKAEDWLNNATSNDWNDPTNWAGGVVPDNSGANNAGIFSATGNIATISSDVTATPAEIILGGFGNTGRIDHVAGTLNTKQSSTGWPPGWMLVGLGDTGNATYNLANTATTGGALTGYGTGSGTLNLADALFMGEPNGSNAGTGVSTINVNTTGALNVHWGMFIGVSGWTANVNVDAGTVSADSISIAQMQNANATAAIGNLNISGGLVTTNTRMTLADGGVNNSATVNQNGGEVSLGTTVDWAGLSMASATGTNNGGTATYNLNGGTLSTRYVISDNSDTNTKGTSIFNFNGGTLKAIADRPFSYAQLMGGVEGITHAYVKAGGAVIDTNGFNELVGAGLEGDINSTGGGLTKNGAGLLTLAGTNTYTGNTVVNAGTLALDSTGSIKFTLGANGVSSKITGAGSLSLNGTFTLDLSGAAIADGNQWQLVDTGFTSLFYDSGFNVSGFTNTGGTWTMADGNDNWTFSQSTGVLAVAVVPEPGTYAMFLVGLGSLHLLRRRRA